MPEKVCSGLVPGWGVFLREPLSPGEQEAARVPITGPLDVARLVGPRIKLEVAEVVYVLCLDAHFQLLHLQEVGKGGLTQCGAEPADFFRIAVAVGARTIVIVHNHPSGDPTPSDGDKIFTLRLVTAGYILGISVFDHVVIGAGAGKVRFASFRKKGLLG